MPSIEPLRRSVIAHSLFAPQDLKGAIERMGFIQADPIRSPARAQDLILRHRVRGYRAGDLEEQYPHLGIEEDFLYAYGFARRDIWSIIHPRPSRKLTKFERRVLDAVDEIGTAHPRDLDNALGGERVKNAWGGFSKQTKQALEALHHHGHLRVAGREKGIRLYATACESENGLSNEERYRRLLLSVLNVFGLTTASFLLSELPHFSHLVGGRKEGRKMIDLLIESGEIRSHRIDTIDYISPVEFSHANECQERALILAPFDPLVRDRRRFEHLWGWAYRFEAYVPAAKRERGYYAMPLLWKDRVVGWVNAKVVANSLVAEIGYVGKPPREKGFRQALSEELSDFARFLHLNADRWQLSET